MRRIYIFILFLTSCFSLSAVDVNDLKDKSGEEILGDLNNIKDFGVGFNMPVGFEG